MKISCQALTKTYKQPVLNSIDFSIEKEMIAIVGKSGSGKSTLLHLLAGLDTPTSGTVFFDNHPVDKMADKQISLIRNHEIGFIFQFHHLLDMTVLDNVLLPQIGKKFGKKEMLKRAKDLLEQVGLKDKLNHKPSELSGGECQRVAIARALVNQPSFVFADEPTGSLDQSTGQQILSLMKDFHQQGTSFLIVTHDENIATQMQCRQMINGKLR